MGDELKLILHQRTGQLKKQIIENDKRYLDYINKVDDFKRANSSPKKALLKESFYQELDGLLDLRFLIQQKPYETSYKNQLIYEEKIMNQQIQNCFFNNIQINKEPFSLNSFNKGVPKKLHWFEWSKKTIHLFDLINQTHEIIDLKIDFKILMFSRSVVTKEGEIFLLGGENESGASNQVYSCFIEKVAQERVLTVRKSMLHHKFDFSLCCFQNKLYVMCGKNSQKSVVNTCECFDIKENRWQKIESCNFKRYAASCCGLEGHNKIYLFGGRTGLSDQMIQNVEEYCIQTNKWKMLANIENMELWTPVEVLCSVQTMPGQIMIFGGCDIDV